MIASGRRIDVLVGGAGGLTGIVVGAVEGLDPAATVAAAALGGALGLVRTRPTAAWLTAAATFVAVSAAADMSEAPFSTYALFALHALGAGRYLGGRSSALVALAGLLVASLGGAAVDEGAAVPAVFVPISAWLAGRAVREHAVLGARLSERAQELETEREAHAQLSVRYERARIASELHDIVAHAISVMVVQASAGQRLVAADPELAQEAFGAIGDAARQAEQDMGRLVDLLADRNEIGPAPDLGLVEELVSRASGSGLDVTLRLEGERSGLPAEVVQTAYRTVQESLTNAMRYAAGASVGVVVRGEPRALVIEVVNAPADTAPELAGQGSGSGLRGLRDRIGTLGGSLVAVPTFDGGWRVRAHIPKTTTAGEHSHA
ncbi:MAG: histidine kinase [Solirubrobacteraceae bacterium]